jgi:hypothetical protein
VRHEYVGDEEAMPQLISILDRPWLAPNLQMAAFWTWFRTSKTMCPWPCTLIAHEYADMLTIEISAMLAGQVTPEQARHSVQDRMLSWQAASTLLPWLPLRVTAEPSEASVTTWALPAAEAMVVGGLIDSLARDSWPG